MQHLEQRGGGIFCIAAQLPEHRSAEAELFDVIDLALHDRGVVEGHPQPVVAGSEEEAGFGLRVFKNLIENALKYSKDKVTVTIDSPRISVEDKGVGIAPKDIDKVTKKFYRSGEHNWDNSMGLGLSIVKTILTLHHTKLEIESELNKGSVFSFILE